MAQTSVDADAETGVNAGADAGAQLEPYFVSININGVDQSGIFPVLSEEGRFLLEVRAYAVLGLMTPDVTPTQYGGRSFLPLVQVPGLQSEFELRRQHLDITCTPDCFPGSSQAIGWLYRPPDPAPLGMFVNYDVMAEKSGSNHFYGGLAEVGVFSNRGSGNLTFSARDASGDSKVTRLDTNWTVDYPDKRLRLRVGDSVTQHGGWGRAVRFGGIQYGTDFQLQPGFVSFPTPLVSGAASLPSTVEIFVNGVRRSSLGVEPGPFTIEQPPVISGSGELQVVIRDLLGRETVLMQPFYASRRLLRSGLKEYSVNAGVLRKNYGLISNDYDESFVAGNYRQGLSDQFTAGIYTEASTKRAGIGPYVDWKIPIGGILSTAAAVSVKGGAAGALFQLDYSWDSQSLGVNVSNEWITKDFSRLGTNIDRSEPRMRNSANVGFNVGVRGALSLNYTRIDERIRQDFQVAGANFSWQLGDFGALSANLSRTFGEFQDTSVFISFTTLLAERTTGSTSVDRSGGKWSGRVRANRSVSNDGGFGYRAEASRGDGGRERAGATYDSRRAIFTLDHSRLNARNTTRFGVRGGVALLGGKAYLANPINDSFALVKVGDFEGVRVQRDNRLVAKTNQSGHALIAGLRSYEDNRITINPLDLPLTADIGAVSLMSVPRRRSGVIVDFSVTRTVAAFVTVVDSSGEPLPPGTVLQVVDHDARFPVGFRGEVYITGLERPLELRAMTASGDCIIHIGAIVPSANPVRLGTVVCVGVNQ